MCVPCSDEGAVIPTEAQAVLETVQVPFQVHNVKRASPPHPAVLSSAPLH